MDQNVGKLPVQTNNFELLESLLQKSHGLLPDACRGHVHSLLEILVELFRFGMLN